MEDKMFGLIIKIYSEFTEFRKRNKDVILMGLKMIIFKDDINGLKDDINGLKDDINGLKDDVNGLKDDVNGLKGDVVRLNTN